MSSIHNLPENLRFIHVYVYAEALCAQTLPFILLSQALWGKMTANWKLQTEPQRCPELLHHLCWTVEAVFKLPASTGKCGAGEICAYSSLFPVELDQSVTLMRDCLHSP